MPLFGNMTVEELLREYDRQPNSIAVLRECARRLRDLADEKQALRDLLDRIEDQA